MKWVTGEIAGHARAAIAFAARGLDFYSVQFQRIDDRLTRVHRKALLRARQFDFERRVGVVARCSRRRARCGETLAMDSVAWLVSACRFDGIHESCWAAVVQVRAIWTALQGRLQIEPLAGVAVVVVDRRQPAGNKTAQCPRKRGSLRRAGAIMHMKCFAATLNFGDHGHERGDPYPASDEDI